jgi:hypothetical protein
VLLSYSEGQTPLGHNWATIRRKGLLANGFQNKDLSLD